MTITVLEYQTQLPFFLPRKKNSFRKLGAHLEKVLMAFLLPSDNWPRSICCQTISFHVDKKRWWGCRQIFCICINDFHSRKHKKKNQTEGINTATIAAQTWGYTHLSGDWMTSKSSTSTTAWCDASRAASVLSSASFRYLRTTSSSDFGLTYVARDKHENDEYT